MLIMSIYVSLSGPIGSKGRRLVRRRPLLPIKVRRLKPNGSAAKTT